MNLQEAYKAAVEMPIKFLPTIRISCGIMGRVLYLEEDVQNSRIAMVNEPGSGDETFYITAEELLSNEWTVSHD